MPIQLSSEITSHDNVSGLSICQQQHTIMVYQDQVPQYQIEVMDKIIASVVYCSYVYYVTERENDIQVTIYDGVLSIVITQQSVEIKPQINNVRFIFSEKQLYLLIQQSNTDYIFLLSFNDNQYNVKKMKIGMADSNSLYYKVTWATDFVISDDNILLMYNPEDHIVYQWNIVNLTDSQSDKPIPICYLLTDPLKIQGAIFLYLNNRVSGSNIYIKNDQALDNGKLVQKNNFFDVVESKGQYILIQDGQQLIFNNKQLLTQFLSISGVAWSQEEILSIGESIGQIMVENNYQQKIMDYKIEDNNFNIKLQHYSDVKEINFLFLEQEVTVYGFLYLDSNNLFIVINNKVYFVTQEAAQDNIRDEPRYQAKEILILENEDAISKVLFSFKTQNDVLYNPLDEIIVCCNYKDYTQIYTDLSSKPIYISYKLLAYTYFRSQIYFVTYNRLGVIINNNIDQLIDIEEDQNLLDVKVYCENCYLVLSQTHLYLIISYNNRKVIYKENIQKFQPQYINVRNYDIQIFGINNFEGGGIVQKLAKLYSLISDEKQTSKEIQRFLQTEFGNQKVKFNAFPLAKQLSLKKDCHIALLTLTKCFQTAEIMELSFKYLNTNQEFLIRYAQILLEASPDTQLLLFQKIIQKINIEQYKVIFTQLLINQNICINELHFDRVESYMVYLNYIMNNILRQNSGVFILFSKICKISDEQILSLLNDYKDLLLSKLDLKNAIVLAKQAILQPEIALEYQKSSQYISRCQTAQERWVDLVRTVSSVFQISAVQGQKISAFHFKSDFQINSEAYKCLRNLLLSISIQKWDFLINKRSQFLPTFQAFKKEKEQENCPQQNNLAQEEINFQMQTYDQNESQNKTIEQKELQNNQVQDKKEIKPQIDDNEEEDEWAALETHKKKKFTKIRIKDINSSKNNQQLNLASFTGTGDTTIDLSEAIGRNSLLPEVKTMSINSNFMTQSNTKDLDANISVKDTNYQTQNQPENNIQNEIPVLATAEQINQTQFNKYQSIQSKDNDQTWDSWGQGESNTNWGTAWDST